MIRGDPRPAWTGDALTGPYSAASGMTHFSALAPSGSAPTQGDLLSHRYHHHVAVGLTSSRVWVACSSSGTNEDAGGQMVVACSMPKNGSSFSAPTLIVSAQSTWSGAGASSENLSRVAYPRSTIVYGGVTYLISAIDTFSTGGRNGSALVACELRDDGEIGTLIRISTPTYDPLNGIDAIPYDATLGPPLYATARLFGTWGGSQPAAAVATDWVGFATQDGDEFAEPTTFSVNASGSYLYRFWRKTSGSNTGFWWIDTSIDYGETWSRLSMSLIPNSPSAGYIGRVSATRAILLFNPRALTTDRDPLAALIYNPTTGKPLGLYAIRQGLSGTPTYAGTNKSGGAAYPGFAADATDVWIGYSMQKESIGVTRLPLSSI